MVSKESSKTLKYHTFLEKAFVLFTFAVSVTEENEKISKNNQWRHFLV